MMMKRLFVVLHIYIFFKMGEVARQRKQVGLRLFSICRCLELCSFRLTDTRKPVKDLYFSLLKMLHLDVTTRWVLLLSTWGKQAVLVAAS